jgi:hypothetical protein
VDTGQRGTGITRTTGTVVVGQAEHTPAAGTVTPTNPHVTVEQVADALNATRAAPTSLNGPVYPTDTAGSPNTYTFTIDGPALTLTSASPTTVTFTGTCTTGDTTTSITGAAALYSNPRTKTVICDTRSALRATNSYGSVVTDWCRSARSTPTP